MHKRHLVYCLRKMSVAVKLQLCHSQLTLYASNIKNTFCVTPPKDEQIMLETCRGLLIPNKLNEKCVKLVSSYCYYNHFLGSSLSIQGTRLRFSLCRKPRRHQSLCRRSNQGEYLGKPRSPLPPLHLYT
jgi:hypothetical protein